MSLPELPDGFYWMISSVGPDVITVSLFANNTHPGFASLGGESVSVKGIYSKSVIATAVEDAAKRIYNTLQREVYIRSIIEEKWPQHIRS